MVAARNSLAASCLLQTEPGEECVSEAEKVAMDLKDPNRPRFTLQELRDVLHERNELKSKVFLLQEELAYYKRCVSVSSQAASFLGSCSLGMVSSWKTRIASLSSCK